MKNIRVELHDELYHRLRSLCDHHGEFSHFIRKAVTRFIIEEEQRRNQLNGTPTRPASSSHSTMEKRQDN